LPKKHWGKDWRKVTRGKNGLAQKSTESGCVSFPRAISPLEKTLALKREILGEPGAKKKNAKKQRTETRRKQGEKVFKGTLANKKKNVIGEENR